jgi:predicted alpha/beta superfamily hydrolase
MPNVINKSITDSIPYGPYNRVVDTLGILSDAYLKFQVKELKPYFDSAYATIPEAKNTTIMGSSMGGMISLYALQQYPEVFGNTICISTHWPAFSGVSVEGIAEKLPAAGNNRIYFDYGTATLDSLYEPYQVQVDSILKSKGYIQGDEWQTKKFEGAAHIEDAWQQRVHVPLKFLLGRD